MSLRTLDIPERQILVYFENNRVPWHARILLVRVSGSRWIWATPTFEIQREDLSEVEDLRPLGRDEPFPSDCRPLVAFDSCSEELQQMRPDATSYADVLSVAAPVPASSSEAAWVFADASNDRFGNEVPAESMAGGRALIRGSWALVQEPGDHDSWTVAERVKPDDRGEWLDEKRSGAGKDPRLNMGSGAESESAPARRGRQPAARGMHAAHGVPVAHAVAVAHGAAVARGVAASHNLLRPLEGLWPMAWLQPMEGARGPRRARNHGVPVALPARVHHHL